LRQEKKDIRNKNLQPDWPGDLARFRQALDL
jgi:hypothetical protein